MAPQLLLYLYLRQRLPDPRRPNRARFVRYALAAVFTFFNFPWLILIDRVWFANAWGISRIPFMAPWIAWQILGWMFLAFVAVYVTGKSVVWAVQRMLRDTRHRTRPAQELPGPASRVPPGLSRRRFLARATYAYAGLGGALSMYGIWDAERLPEVTRRTLTFPDLPAQWNGLKLLHLSDVHAGIHMERDKMQEIVALANSLHPDLILQTGDMIDISQTYVPEYVRAFRDLSAPLGVVTCLGNHDRYTGEAVVVKGVRDAGQIFLKNDVHVLERGGAALALLGIDDPHNWMADDPQDRDVDMAVRAAPDGVFRILLAHRPGAFDAAAPRGIQLTLAGHIHGGQIYLPVIGWSAGRLITKYVMGQFQKGDSQLYVSRGIGVVGVPIRLFVPPEIAVLELRRA